MERALFDVLRARRDCGDKKTGAPCIHSPDATTTRDVSEGINRHHGL